MSNNSDNQVGKVTKYLVAPTTYNVSNDVDVIEVNTSSGGVTTIYLQTITIGSPRKPVYINDNSNNASVGNIIVIATGGNKINNAPSITLDSNGVSAQIVIADRSRFIANLNGDSPVPPTPDKNFVFVQGLPNVTWFVPHNLNKRCAVQVVDNAFNEIEAEILWVDDNNVTITLNSAETGYVYCN